MSKIKFDFNDPKFIAAAGPLVSFGAAKQKKAITEETRDRKAVNTDVDAFWKKASLNARRAFLTQLEGFAPERNVTRLQRFGANLTEAEPAAVQSATATQPVAKKDVGKAE